MASNVGTPRTYSQLYSWADAHAQLLVRHPGGAERGAQALAAEPGERRLAGGG